MTKPRPNYKADLSACKAVSAALMRQSLDLEAECAKYRQALELIASPKRPDGTYNRDREACEQLARAALSGEKEPK